MKDLFFLQPMLEMMDRQMQLTQHGVTLNAFKEVDEMYWRAVRAHPKSHKKQMEQFREEFRERKEWLSNTYKQLKERR